MFAEIGGRFHAQLCVCVCVLLMGHGGDFGCQGHALHCVDHDWKVHMASQAYRGVLMTSQAYDHGVVVGVSAPQGRTGFVKFPSERRDPETLRMWVNTVAGKQ